MAFEVNTPFHNIQANVRKWAREKGLDGPDGLARQVEKLEEEVYEVALEVISQDKEKAKMELGDCLVVCTIIAMKLGSNVEECMGMAYEKIKNRKGKTEGGVFVKEE